MYLKISVFCLIFLAASCGSGGDEYHDVRETVLEQRLEESQNGWAQLCLTATAEADEFFGRALSIKATCAKVFINLRKNSNDIEVVGDLIAEGFDVVVVYVLHGGDEPILGRLAANDPTLMTLYTAASRRIYEMQRMYEMRYGTSAPHVSQVALHEINGGWYIHGAYYPGNQREDVAAAWQNVVQAMRLENDRVYTVVNLNRVSHGDRGVKDLVFFVNAMPADEYSFNAYNRMGTSQWHKQWQGPREAIEDALHAIANVTNSPVSIGETSTVSGDNSTLIVQCILCSKEDWIRDMLQLRKNESDLHRMKRVTFFDEDKWYDGILRDWNVTRQYAFVFRE